MKKDDLQVEKNKSFLEGRAVIAGVVAVTVFLCLFTAFEIFTIKMEWNIPVMNGFIGGSDNYIFSHYREEEEKLEESMENVPKEGGKTEFQASQPGAESTESEQLANSNEQAEENEYIQMTEGTELAEKTEEDANADTEVAEETGQEEELPYYIKINRQQNVITIYEKDENGEYTVPVKAILCSTGLYNATPKGVFHLSSKYIWRQLNGGVYGQYASRITGGVLFHSVPYASKNKSTLYWDKYNKLGQQASMGCVRLTVEDAKWIYDNCPSGTAVEVYDSEDPGPLGKPEALKLDKDNVNRGWDPTDPDENNPWHQWSEDK